MPASTLELEMAWRFLREPPSPAIVSLRYSYLLLLSLEYVCVNKRRPLCSVRRTVRPETSHTGSTSFGFVTTIDYLVFPPSPPTASSFHPRCIY